MHSKKRLNDLANNAKDRNGRPIGEVPVIYQMLTTLSYRFGIISMVFLWLWLYFPERKQEL